MANVGDMLMVLAFAAFVLAAIVGLAFLAGYVIGRILL
jgi:preprotein translocase subunit SecE